MGISTLKYDSSVEIDFYFSMRSLGSEFNGFVVSRVLGITGETSGLENRFTQRRKGAKTRWNWAALAGRLGGGVGLETLLFPPEMEGYSGYYG